MIMINAVFFDLGGVILDNITFIENHGIELDVKLLKDIGYTFTKKEVGKALKKTSDSLEIKYRGSTEKYKEGLFFFLMCKFLGVDICMELAKKKDFEFYETRLKHSKLLPYAIELLKLLRKRKLKLALITNDSIKAYLGYDRIYRFKKYFDLVVVSEEIGAEKSALVPLKHALMKLKLDPKEVVMVGDRMDEDIIAGKKLEMKTVRVDWKFSRKFKYVDYSEADYVIRNLRELKPIIESMQNHN